MLIAERYYGCIFLLATGALILASLWGARLGQPAALALLVAGVIVLGLPHGALDPMVARKAFESRRNYSTASFYAVYLVLALGYCLLWLRFPTLGLSAFLAIAAIHFGSDWQHRGSALTRLAYGVTVVTLPALAHPAEVAGIYSILGTSHAQTLVELSKVLGAMAAVVGFVGAILQVKQCKTDLPEFLAIVMAALLLGPLVFFTCYFSLLHSPRHLLETSADLGITSLRGVWVKTLPIVAATVALCGVLYFALPGISVSGRLLMTVFIGLASLTIPHMLLDTLASPS
jgi:Brp/Blh family beta-carotene 15,15'-monooxygenase